MSIHRSGLFASLGYSILIMVPFMFLPGASSATALEWPYVPAPIVTDDFGPRVISGGSCGNNIDYHLSRIRVVVDLKSTHDEPKSMALFRFSC